MIYLNLSIVGVIIAIIIAIIQLVIYRKDSDNQCRSRKLNLGFGITSIILCSIWIILMIILNIKQMEIAGFSII
jgi:amino acid transporter